MKDTEMTKIFSVMLLAWPNAEAFKGGIERLKPTVQLWTACTADVDFWTGQQAVVHLCQRCKFPPTIAEFREQVARVRDWIKQTTDQTVQEIRDAEAMHGSIAAFYAKLPPGNLTRAVIDAVGGIDALSCTWKDSSGQEYSAWNLREIENACRAVLRGRPAMPGVELPDPGVKRGR